MLSVHPAPAQEPCTSLALGQPNASDGVWARHKLGSHAAAARSGGRRASCTDLVLSKASLQGRHIPLEAGDHLRVLR